MGIEGYAIFYCESKGRSCPCDYIDYQPNVRETLNLKVIAVKYAVYTKYKCILRQIWVKLHIFHPFLLHFSTS